ncbi:MAG: hypothetical protein EXR62_15285 [Chloroflexi bacterium]|nr:hypothetical protein [Chloroflexota bacterium]
MELQSNFSTNFNTWQVWPWQVAPADRQLATSYCMVESSMSNTGPCLRWYMIDPPALIMGAGQRIDVIDMVACRTLGLQIYRRNSGGAAVWADNTMLGLDIFLPHDHPLLLPDLTESYRWLGQLWLETLVQLQAEFIGGKSQHLERSNTAPTSEDALEKRRLPLRLVTVTEARLQHKVLQDQEPELWQHLSLACYGTLSPYEIVAGKRKILGLSQVRRRAGGLFQAGLLLRWEPGALANCLNIPQAEKNQATEDLGRVAIGLDTLLGSQADFSQIVSQTIENFSAMLQVKLKISLISCPLPPRVEENLATISQSKFAALETNMG